MPLARFVLIVVLVVSAAGLSVWLAAALSAAVGHPLLGLAATLPVLLLVYLLWRVISDRMRDKDEARYDRIGK